MSTSSTSLASGTVSEVYPLNDEVVEKAHPTVTFAEFMEEKKLIKIGEGFDVRVVANPAFPSYVVKEYNCGRAKLKYLFDNEIAATKRVSERLKNEKLSRVVFPELYASETKDLLHFEMFPRIYPPSATSAEDTGEMIGINFSKKSFYVDGKAHYAGRGHIIEPTHLKEYFHEEVPHVLNELGKAFALMHFKAFIIGADVEVVIGKSAPSEPLKLFIIDLDRAGVCNFFSREEYTNKHGSLSMADYFKYHYPFGKSFQDFSKIDKEFKAPFIQGYLGTAETLGFRSEAEILANGL